MTRKFFQIEADGKRFIDHFKTLEVAEAMAQEMANSMKWKTIEIVEVTETSKPLCKVKAKSLYKMF